ncbi:MAG: N-6 DNA methylase [Verrucomicrobiales bacterium]
MTSIQQNEELKRRIWQIANDVRGTPYGQKTVNKVYDPAAGSGSLLLQPKKHMDDHLIEDGIFGQEINHTTYNLARMNMFLHNVNYD